MSLYLMRVGIALSVLLNVLLGGQSNQTFSARNWGWKREGKANLVFIIDPLFLAYAKSYNKLAKRFSFEYTIINLENHCLESWTYWYLRKNVD